MQEQKYAIRFGLGGIKAVGIKVMEKAVEERKESGNFENIYNFSTRLDPKNINKKSIEALAKSGAFDELIKNRRQIAESYDILANYASDKREEAISNQMNLFGGMPEMNKDPELKKISDWNKEERLNKEFEAFGFFLNEHPLDDKLSELRKRGAIFSDKLERDELEDGNLVKFAGVVASSKHRSGSRGRFAYLNISDPYGIFEVVIFDEALITAARDILADGSIISLECLVRKDEGGTRIMVKDVKKLDDFIKLTKAKDKDFEDIKKIRMRKFTPKKEEEKQEPTPLTPTPQLNKVVFKRVEILINDRNAILTIKSILSQKMAPQGAENNTKVILGILGNNQFQKVELPKNYHLDNADISRIKTIQGICDIEFS